jgi:hypothetical protein
VLVHGVGAKDNGHPIRNTRQYSQASTAFSSRMDARRALQLTRGVVNVSLILMLTAKFLGPGRFRLEMVKFAHELNERRGDLVAFQGAPETLNDWSHGHSAEPDAASVRQTRLQFGKRPARTRRRVRGLRLREAFLIRVNDFDRLLEFSLRRRLDPVVAAPVPSATTSRPRRSARLWSSYPKQRRAKEAVLRQHPSRPTELKRRAKSFPARLLQPLLGC